MEEGILRRSSESSQENCTKWNTTHGPTSPNGTTLCSGRIDGEWSPFDVLDDGHESMRPWQVASFGILAAYTSLLTVIGNLIVILSFILERSIRQTSNYFIASLAVSDLLIGCVSMPLYTVYMLSGQHWPLGEVLCDLWLSLDYTVCLCSIYTVFCITIDRYCSVTIPASYHKWRTERKVIVIVGITWTVPVIVFFTSIIGWQYFVHQRTVPVGKCYVQYMENALFNCLLQVGYFWVTLFVMCVLYAGIYRVALRLHRKSEKRRKKMTSLVSMAGETITKIGIGVTGQQKRQDAAAAAAAAEAVTIGMQMLQVPKRHSDDLQDDCTIRSSRFSSGTHFGMGLKDDWSQVKGNELLERSGHSTMRIKGVAPGLVVENRFIEDARSKGIVSADDDGGYVEIRDPVNNSSLLAQVQSSMTQQSSSGVDRCNCNSMDEVQKDIGVAQRHQVETTSFRVLAPEKTVAFTQRSKVILEDGITNGIDHQGQSGQVDSESQYLEMFPGHLVCKKIRLGERNCSWTEDLIVNRGNIPFLCEKFGNVKSAEELLRGEGELNECLTQTLDRLSRPWSTCSTGDRSKALLDSAQEGQPTNGDPLNLLRLEQTAILLDGTFSKRRKGRATLRSSLPSEMIWLSGIGEDTIKSGHDDQKMLRNGSSVATRHCDALPDVEEGVGQRGTQLQNTTEGDEFASPLPQESSLFFANYPAQTSCESDCPEQAYLLAPPDSSTGPSCDAASFCSGVSRNIPERERRRKSRFLASRKWSSRKRAEKRRELGRRCGDAEGDGDGAAEDTDERHQYQQQQSRQKHENRAKKSLRTITLILGAFVICWTPWHILSLIIGFCPGSAVCVPPILYDISYWLCYINSPINPFCYAFANQQLKKTFVRILRLDWHKT